ncbi:MAG: hypothetical protein HKN22_08625, partial [Bacteroidia bacterium]|nr:hypothetical protein [Bacteroidia bacterium]
GCDVVRGLGFCYNGDEDDETISGYGINPPAIGIDFLQGPIADVNDGIDNDRDGVVDEFEEQIIMSKFMYYNSVNSAPTGNPSNYPDFYTYLRGLWMDGQPLTYGGDGRDPNGQPCSFMFPWDTDTFSNIWSEATAGNAPADRRFLMSVGPFTMLPGAVQYITTGIVWARAKSGGNLASVRVLKKADDKAQALFDRCFQVLEGPAAPDLVIEEFENKLILTLKNYNNDSVQNFDIEDAGISTEFCSDNHYRFEGYQIYQLANAEVKINPDGPQDPDLTRVIAQVDISNGINKLVNNKYYPEKDLNVPYLAVKGQDLGLEYTFEVTRDHFAKGDPELINHKTYYYSVVSYAHNEYSFIDPADSANFTPQTKPYLSSRNNVMAYAAIPHKRFPEPGRITLDDIRVVPNPYYAFSVYENTATENHIKFTNLPPECTIRIYTVKGDLVKDIKRNVGSNNYYGAIAGGETDASETWDLKNNRDLPISSGLYLVHIQAPGIGEKILKWYGVIRESDIDNY